MCTFPVLPHSDPVVATMSESIRHTTESLTVEDPSTGNEDLPASEDDVKDIYFVFTPDLSVSVSGPSANIVVRRSRRTVSTNPSWTLQYPENVILQLNIMPTVLINGRPLYTPANLGVMFTA